MVDEREKFIMKEETNELARPIPSLNIENEEIPIEEYIAFPL